MPDLIEVSTWDVARVVHEIHLLLPKGWGFTLNPKESYWFAAYTDADGKETWANVGPACNVLAFDAYGWLWLKVNPPTLKRTAWSLRANTPIHPIQKSAVIPDPVDLDPQEVTAVFLKSRQPV